MVVDFLCFTIHNYDQQCKLQSHGSSLLLIAHLEAGFSSRLKVRLNVPWIQVSDTHQKPWSSEGPEFTETEDLDERQHNCIFLTDVAI